MDAAPVALIDRFVQCECGEVSLNAITWVELCCGMDAQNSRDEIMVLFPNLLHGTLLWVRLPFSENYRSNSPAEKQL